MGLWLCLPPKKILKKSTLKSHIFQHYYRLNGLFCSGVKAGLEIGLTKITESTPRTQSTAHVTPDLFIEHLSKAEVHFLVFRCLNLYSLLGALLQLGALSARLVRMGYLATSRQYGNVRSARSSPPKRRSAFVAAHLSTRICRRDFVCALLSARNYPARYCL